MGRILPSDQTLGEQHRPSLVSASVYVLTSQVRFTTLHKSGEVQYMERGVRTKSNLPVTKHKSIMYFRGPC